MPWAALMGLLATLKAFDQGFYYYKKRACLTSMGIGIFWRPWHGMDVEPGVGMGLAVERLLCAALVFFVSRIPLRPTFALLSSLVDVVEMHGFALYPFFYSVLTGDSRFYITDLSRLPLRMLG